MNENVRMGLEMLKMETLSVLYKQHLQEGGPLTIKRVRQIMGIPIAPLARNPNDMVAQFLCHLAKDKLAHWEYRDKWTITQAGIDLVENW